MDGERPLQQLGDARCDIVVEPMTRAPFRGEGRTVRLEAHAQRRARLCGACEGYDPEQEPASPPPGPAHCSAARIART
jgi:hypothetical protein